MQFFTILPKFYSSTSQPHLRSPKEWHKKSSHTDLKMPDAVC